MKIVSYIAPCYNEESVIKEYYKRVSSVAQENPIYKFEFIIVNDCSTDRSKNILNELGLKDSRVKLVHFAANRGHQTALFAGIEHANGDFNITLDIDLQDPPELFYDFFKKFDQGFQVVHAQRRVRHGESLFKRLTAKIFYKFLKFVSNIDLIENCGDFRAFTKDVRVSICLFREKHKFLRGLFILIGFNQTTIQYERDKRFAGKTKYTLRKMFILATNAIFSFSNFPIRLILFLSFFMWGISLVYLGKALISKFLYNETIQGWTSIIFLQVFFTGIVLSAIAIIGSYVGRIYEQGQNRPLYWVEKKKNLK